MRIGQKMADRYQLSTTAAIRTPAGVTDAQGYRPFSKQETIAIFKEVKRRGAPMKTMPLHLAVYWLSIE